MIFNNLRFNGLKIDLFSLADCWSCFAKKKFVLSTGENDLKVALCQTDLCYVEYFLALQHKISSWY